MVIQTKLALKKLTNGATMTITTEAEFRAAQDELWHRTIVSSALCKELADALDAFEKKQKAENTKGAGSEV